MANDSKKVSQLGITTALANTDRVVVLTNAAASAQTQTITLANLGKSLTTNAIPIANSTQLGIVKIGEGLSVAANGMVRLNSHVANSSALGFVKIGSGIQVDGSGVISTVIPITNTDYVGYMLTTNSAGNAEWSRFTGVYEVVKIDQSGRNTYNVNNKEAVILVNPAVVGSDVTITFPIASAIEGKEILVKLLDASTGHKVTITTQDIGNAYLEDPITGAFVTSYDLIDSGQAETWIHDGTVYRHLSTARATPIFYTNANNYAQVVVKNNSAGENSSADLALYNNLGDNIAGTGPFIDIGIDGSNYSNLLYSLYGPNDGYVYIDSDGQNGGNLLLGTARDTSIILHANGVQTNNKVMVVNSTYFSVNTAMEFNVRTDDLVGNAFTQTYQTRNSWEVYPEDDTGPYPAWAWIRAELPDPARPVVFIENKNGATDETFTWAFQSNGALNFPGFKTVIANGNITSSNVNVTNGFYISNSNVYDNLLRPLLNPNALDINADGGTSTSVFAIRDEAFTGGGSTTVFGRYEAALDGGVSFNNRHSASYIDGGGANVL